MDKNRNEPRWLRFTSAIFFGMILLAVLLPNATHFPIPVGLVVVSMGCILFGITRRNSGETIGWCLYGIIVLWMVFGG